jgi:hypothetical protein
LSVEKFAIRNPLRFIPPNIMGNLTNDSAKF